jgi:hypothetical protein
LIVAAQATLTNVMPISERSEIWRGVCRSFSAMPYKRNVVFHGEHSPGGFWSAKNFAAVVGRTGFDLILEGAHTGYYPQPDKALPMAQFNERYRPAPFCQLVFRGQSANH